MVVFIQSYYGLYYMSEKVRLSDHQKDTKAEFEAAIDTLNEFNQLNDSSFLSGLKHLVAETLSGKKREVQLKQAIQILKRHYPLLTKHDQALASFARSAINRFNAVIDKAKQGHFDSAKEKIAAFITSTLSHEIGRIDLPPESSMLLEFSDLKKINSIAPSSEKIAKLPQLQAAIPPIIKQSVNHLSSQAVLLFHMKVIALIEKHHILSHKETRNLVKTASMHAEPNAEQNICIATCELSPFPGQTITVTGAFEKDPKESLYNIPSRTHPFQLSITSTQKGFPHPSQLGWALPDLLPEYPQNLEKLPLFNDLYQRKQILAKQLHPHQDLLQKARRQLEAKKIAFNDAKEAMLELHQILCVAIAKAANESILSFFARLKQIHHPYDYLCSTYQLINEMFYKRLQTSLQNAWHIGRLSMRFSADTNLAVAKEILETETLKIQQEFQKKRESAASDLERGAIDFILFMGCKLQPWQELILQQFSDLIPLHVPTLSDFAERLLIVSLGQFTAFEKDLLSSDEGDTLKFMCERLAYDTNIFETQFLGEKELTLIATELNAYYSSQRLLPLS